VQLHLAHWRYQTRTNFSERDEARSGDSTWEAAKFHGGGSIWSAKFSQHTVNVVLDSLFREVKIYRDLFVREAPVDQMQQLLLAPGQAEVGLERQLQSSRPLHSDVPEQNIAEIGRANGFPPGHATNRSGDFSRGSLC
jgi:hypothetical protein